MEKQQEMERILQMYDSLPADKKAQFDLMVQMALGMLITFLEINAPDYWTKQRKKA